MIINFVDLDTKNTEKLLFDAIEDAFDKYLESDFRHSDYFLTENNYQEAVKLSIENIKTYLKGE